MFCKYFSSKKGCFKGEDCPFVHYAGEQMTGSRKLPKAKEASVSSADMDRDVTGQEALDATFINEDRVHREKTRHFNKRNGGRRGFYSGSKYSSGQGSSKPLSSRIDEKKAISTRAKTHRSSDLPLEDASIDPSQEGPDENVIMMDSRQCYVGSGNETPHSFITRSGTRSCDGNASSVKLELSKSIVQVQEEASSFTEAENTLNFQRSDKNVRLRKPAGRIVTSPGFGRGRYRHSRGVGYRVLQRASRGHDKVTDTSSDLKVLDAIGNKQHPQERIERSLVPKKICRYWLSPSGCYRGKRCKFLHPEKPQSDTNAVIDAKDTTGDREDGLCETEGSMLEYANHARIGEEAGSAGGDQVVHDGERTVTDNMKQVDSTVPMRLTDPDKKNDLRMENSEPKTLESLRQKEITQLKRRFDPIGCFQVLIQGDQEVYQVVWHPTDPDWPFVIKDFILTLDFPESYPAEMFSATVEDVTEFPEGFARYLNSLVSDWIKKRETNRDKYDLAFRPFLKWFDRNLISLFTKAAKQVKRDEEAKRAGFQFIAFGLSSVVRKGKQMGRIDDSEPSVIAKTNKIIDSHELSTGDQAALEKDSTLTGTETDSNGNDNRESLDVIEKTKNDTESERLIRAQFDIIAEVEGNHSNGREGQAMTGVPAFLPVTYKTGIEMRFTHMTLSNDVATIKGVNLEIEIECKRCNTRKVMTLNPNRSQDLVCQKCRNLQTLEYYPSLMHQSCSSLGFLRPFGCKPFDLISVNCLFKICCLHCDKESELKGLVFGQQRSHWCPACHTKMDILLSSCKFMDHSPALGNRELQEVRAIPKTKVPREPGLHEGQALPDKGTCKHYKKSFRWLRFPCCGKCYPCDVCHDAKEQHEMKFATRMVCGFCSKDQPFHMDKPCIGCGAFLKKGASNHWEGGLGCRNQMKMARNDKQKYAGKNKTAPQKSNKENIKATKKNASK